MVYVEKGGEIIPKIVDIDKTVRKKDMPEFRFIENCPVCGAKLVRSEGMAAHYCPNTHQCPPQIKGKIEHFVSRKAMDINIAEATIDQLYQNNLLNNIADLYELKYDQIINLERFAEKSANNLLKSIENSKNASFERVLYSLGIRFIGETVAKKLAREFITIENIINASFEELIEINEIGDRIAESIRDFFSNKGNIEIINRLRKHGLKFEIDEENKPVSSGLENLNFVISGTFKYFSREELKDLIEKNGGKNQSSVNSKTNYLIAGENMGPSKRKKAEDLNVKIIDEESFEKMISANH